MSGSATAALVSRSGVRAASGLTLTSADQATGRVLPVSTELAALFPWGGLRRGSTVALGGSTSLLFALLATATATGAWAAVVGMPGLGLLAAAELGVAVHRVALVPRPGSELVAVAAALLDGVDMVVLPRTAGQLGLAVLRRLSARARQRGAVLLAIGSWPGADLELNCADGQWVGLGTGHGYLREREVVVQARGRGAAARPRQVRVSLPGAGGMVGTLPGPVDLQVATPVRTAAEAEAR